MRATNDLGIKPRVPFAQQCLGHTIAVHPQTVVVSLFWELLLCIFLRLFHNICLGPNLLELDIDCNSLGIIGGRDVGSISWDRGPAELLDVLLRHAGVG